MEQFYTMVSVQSVLPVYLLIGVTARKMSIITFGLLVANGIRWEKKKTFFLVKGFLLPPPGRQFTFLKHA